MEKSELETNQHIKLSIFASSPDKLSILRDMVESSGLSDRIEISEGNLEKVPSGNSDLTLSLFSEFDNIETYAHHIASLKFLSNTPMVLSIINGNATGVIEEQKSEIAADNFIYLPIENARFTGILKTCFAKFSILNAKTKSQHYAFNRSPQTLGAILVENGVITPLQLKNALDYQLKNEGVLLGDAMVDLGYIDDFQKAHFLGSQMGVSVATPKQYASASLDIVSLIPEYIARENQCIALEKNENELQVAMLDVTNLNLLDSLRDSTGLTIVPLMGTREEITVAIKRFYADINSHQNASALIADMDQDIEFVKSDFDAIDPEEAAAEGAELGIIKLVNMIITNAIRDRASDIHIEPGENDIKIRYRVDGELRKVLSPPKRSHQAIITRIKILSELNIAERRLPQDGRMVVRIAQREVDLRISILPTIMGEKVVMRILDKEAFQASMANLGFNNNENKIFSQNVSRTHGMIIVTGPTGSGKSTTLYAALESLKNRPSNIVSVEDPVEFILEHVNQVQVNNTTGLSFAGALRSILRQDPDTILIGEIRDAETADIAVKMALTGHLVFSTLHTNDAVSAITRLVNIGILPLLLTSCLNLIIAQRLVRRICIRCKKEYAPRPRFLKELNLNGQVPNAKFYKGEGCVNCNGTGFLGRVGIFEMLQITHEIRDLIMANAPPHHIQTKAVEQGMLTLREAGIQQALNGVTTIEQVLAVTTASREALPE